MTTHPATPSIQHQIAETIEQLNGSERGRDALVALRDFIGHHYIGLDGANQQAVHALLWMSRSRPGSVREALEAIRDHPAAT